MGFCSVPLQCLERHPAPLKRSECRLASRRYPSYFGRQLTPSLTFYLGLSVFNDDRESIKPENLMLENVLSVSGPFCSIFGFLQKSLSKLRINVSELVRLP